MSRPLQRAAAWTVLTGASLGGLLFACDEVYADPVTAPVTFGRDSGLTTSRPAPVPCPKELRENAPCAVAETVCEQGTSPDPSCNQRWVCVSDPEGLYWTEASPGDCGGVCPDPALIVDGAPCDVGDAGAGPAAELHCAAAGATCACTTGRDGAHAHPRAWRCKAPEEGCPAERPMLGQECALARSCDYGACLSKRGSRMICADDVWQTEEAACDD